MHRFSGKVGIITGGGTGIGRAVVVAVAEEGAKVVVTGRREGPLAELASALPGAVKYIAADVARSGDPKRVVEFAIEEFGRLDFLVNNAGLGIVKPLAELTDDELDQLNSVNLKGPLAMMREATPHLAEARGSVVNITSVAGQTAVPGFSAYAGTKGGLDRISRVLAAELGPLGIRVNAVAPGLTETKMFEDTMGEQPEAIAAMVQQTALRRLGQSSEVARTVAWLASQDAGWITGQVIQASGGLLL